MQVTGINELNAALRQYQAQVSNPRQKTAILAAGGAKVRQAAAKAPTPKSTEKHYYYSKGKKIEIKPGNLRRSMKVFKGREGDVYVGPRVLRQLPGSTIGQTARTSSGYYAAMIYGSASAFRRTIMEAAAQSAAGAAFQAIEKRFAAWHKTQKAAQ